MPSSLPPPSAEPGSSSAVRDRRHLKVLAAEHPSQQYLNGFLDHALALSSAQSGSLMLLEPDSRALGVVAARGLRGDLIGRARTPFGHPVSGWVAAQQEPVLLNGRRAMERMLGRGLRPRPDIRSSICVPLRAGDVAGTLNLNNRLPSGRFRRDDLDRAKMLAGMAGDVVLLARLARQGTVEAALAADYRTQLMRARDAERRRVGRELHDGALQSLAEVTLRLETLRRHGRAGGDRGALQTVTQTLRRTIREIREIYHDGVPTILASGLLSGLQTFVADFEQRTSIAVSLKHTPVPRLPAETETSLFRIVQEALNNVRKHAKAATVDIRLSWGLDALSLRITDDGQGFEAAPPPPATDGGGFGLASIRERARLLGGHARITSAPGSGTTVQAVLPTSGLQSTRREVVE